MFENTLAVLTEQEPLISAVVGLVTMGAAIWGAAQLVFLRGRNAALEQTLESDHEASITRPAPSTVRTLLDLGLNPQSELEDLISVRTVNIATLCLMMITLWGAVAGLFVSGMIVLTIINGAVFLLALLVLILHASTSGSAAKWMFLLLVVFFWVVIMVVMGPFVGLEYLLPAIMITPILLFSRREKKSLTISVLLICFASIAAIFLQATFPRTMIVSVDFIHFGYYMNAILITVAMFVVMNFYSSFAASSFHDLEEQKFRTDELVHSLLPAYVAERVQNHQSTVADWHSEATVLFANIGGFETLYSRVSAVHMVEMLGEIFTQFDELTKKHGIDKVNTLGTNYVVASGIGNDDEIKHEAVAMFALDALKVVRAFSQSVNHPFSFRAGITTGQVVSGVIGDARPCFDIWGETVELANSMRDTAVENSIVVNEPAYWRLKQLFEFAVTDDSQAAYILLRQKLSTAPLATVAQTL